MFSFECIIALCFIKNMNLNKNYIEKIAAHWARKKVGSAKDAILLAKQENKKYKEINEVRKVRNVSESSNTNVIDMPNGKALHLFLSKASHHQVNKLNSSRGIPQ